MSDAEDGETLIEIDENPLEIVPNPFKSVRRSPRLSPPLSDHLKNDLNYTNKLTEDQDVVLVSETSVTAPATLLMTEDSILQIS